MLNKKIALGALCGIGALSLVTASAGEMPWFEGKHYEAFKKAEAENRKGFFVLGAEWSEMSQRLDHETFTDERVAEALSTMVCMSLDTESYAGKQLTEMFNVQTVPTIVVTLPGGDVEEVIVGYIPPDALLGELDRIHRRDQTVSHFREIVEKHPDDLDARFQLADKLGWIGDVAGRDDIHAEIRRADPEGDSVSGARLIMWDGMWSAINAEQEHGHMDFGELKSFLERTDHHTVRFEGYSWIAQSCKERGNGPDAREAMRRAWPHVADGQARDWANAVAYAFYEQREELNDEERAFALELARAAVSYAENVCAGMDEEKSEREEKRRDDEAEIEDSGEIVDGDGGSDDGGLDRWLAQYIDTLACCQFMNGEVDEAVALTERCIELDPEREDYQARLVQFRSGS